MRKGLREKEKEKKLMDMDSSVVIAGGKKVEAIGKEYEEMNGDRCKLDLGW